MRPRRRTESSLRPQSGFGAGKTSDQARLPDLQLAQSLLPAPHQAWPFRVLWRAIRRQFHGISIRDNDEDIPAPLLSPCPLRERCPIPHHAVILQSAEVEIVRQRVAASREEVPGYRRRRKISCLQFPLPSLQPEHARQLRIQSVLVPDCQFAKPPSFPASSACRLPPR